MKAKSLISLILVFVIFMFLFSVQVSAGTFFDDFNDGNANGWTVLDQPVSDWQILDGGYHGEIFEGAEGIALIGKPDWKVDSIEAKIRDIQGDWVALVWNWEDVYNFDAWWINVNAATVEAWPKIGAYENAARVAIPVPLDVDSEHTLKVVIQGDVFDVYFDGELMGDYTNDTFTTGQVGLLVWNATATFDDVKITGPSIGTDTRGDFDGSGVLDLADVNQLNASIAAKDNQPKYDLNSDRMTNVDDLNIWVRDLKKTWFGDANLDGEFNTADLVAVFTSGKFELATVAAWNEGDWTGDQRFSTSDLVSAFTDGGFEKGPKAAVSSVPEPSTVVLMLFACGLALRSPIRRAADAFVPSLTPNSGRGKGEGR